MKTSASSTYPGPLALPGVSLPLAPTFSGATIVVPEPGFETRLATGLMLLCVMRDKWTDQSANIIPSPGAIRAGPIRGRRTSDPETKA